MVKPSSMFCNNHVIGVSLSEPHADERLGRCVCFPPKIIFCLSVCHSVNVSIF